MNKARAFFFVCAGILCLALAYYLGASSTERRGPVQVEIVKVSPFAITALTTPIPVEVAREPVWVSMKAR